MEWLLIICLGTSSWCQGGSREGGSINAIHVTEQHCRAALAIDRYKTSTFVRCISPNGQLFDNAPRNQ